MAQGQHAGQMKKTHAIGFLLLPFIASCMDREASNIMEGSDKISAACGAELAQELAVKQHLLAELGLVPIASDLEGIAVPYSTEAFQKAGFVAPSSEEIEDLGFVDFDIIPQICVDSNGAIAGDFAIAFNNRMLGLIYDLGPQ